MMRNCHVLQAHCLPQRPAVLFRSKDSLLEMLPLTPLRNRWTIECGRGITWGPAKGSLGDPHTKWGHLGTRKKDHFHTRNHWYKGGGGWGGVVQGRGWVGWAGTREGWVGWVGGYGWGGWAVGWYTGGGDKGGVVVGGKGWVGKYKAPQGKGWVAWMTAAVGGDWGLLQGAATRELKVWVGLV